MTQAGRRPLEKNRLEWFVFAAAALLLVAMVGFLVLQAVQANDPPPEISVTLGRTEPTRDGYRVRVDVRNDGGAAADVEVVVRLYGAEGPPEEAGFVVPLLPRKSVRTGWVVLAGDPAVAERVEARAAGYREP